MVKPEAEGSLQDFVASSSDVMVMSSWDAGQVRRVEGEDDIYCIKVEEFNFVALRFEVELTVQCTLDERTTTASLESLGFRLIGPGLERLADVIDVTVSGKLRPTAPEAKSCSMVASSLSRRASCPRCCAPCRRPPSKRPPSR